VADADEQGRCECDAAEGGGMLLQPHVILPMFSFF
jgi:hypothetical protein